MSSSEPKSEVNSPDSLEQVEALACEFPFQGYIEETEHRGITLKQLRLVLAFIARECCRWRDLAPPGMSSTAGQKLSTEICNLYHLNAWLIMPATAQRNSAFVEMLSAERQTPKWFVSHWWGELIKDFVACVEKHAEIRRMEDTDPYWVCAYANRQHALGEELCSNPKETSFFKAMQLARGVVLMLNAATELSEGATPFTRIWCAFEISMAVSTRNGQAALLLDVATGHDSDVQLLTDGPTAWDREQPKIRPVTYHKAKRELGFPIEIVREGLSLEVQGAKASREQDRVHILNSISGQDLERSPPLKEHEEYNKVNVGLRSTFALAAWRQAMEKGMVTQLGLPKVLGTDGWRSTVEVDLEGCEQMTGADLSCLARCLPKQLSTLVLNFAWCGLLSDSDFAMLAENLPAKLKVLKLVFLRCESLGDPGMETLAKHLPKTLQVFHLDTRWCAKIGAPGLCALATHLPQTLSELNLSPSGHWSLCDKSILAALGANLCQQMRRLSLDFTGARYLRDTWVAALCRTLPRSLENFALHLNSCQHVGDPGIAALARGLPKQLASLRLDLWMCVDVGDRGVAALARGLPSTLTELVLRVTGCEQVTDLGLAALARSMPASLRRLRLRLQNTGVSDELVEQFTAPSEKVAPDAWCELESLKTWASNAPLGEVEPAEPPKVAASSRSKEKTQELKRRFKRMDRNGNGKLTYYEMRDLLRKGNSRMTEAECRRLFKAVDKSGDGNVDFEEFVDYICS